jgi:hypothetical protein
MKTRITWLVAIALFAGAVGFGVRPAAEAAPGHRKPLANIPVTGTVANGGTFRGTLDITNFYSENNALFANGLLDGKLYDAAGHEIGSVTNELAQGFPVTVDGAAGPAAPNPPPVTCNILTLDLGPLHLDLLGLVVDLNAIHLTITAVQGPGNLLGNLLCAIAHLLDGNPLIGILGQIADLLNRIIDLLGTLP